MPGSEHSHQKNTHYNQAYARAILPLYFPHDHLHHQKGWHRSKNEQLGKGAGSSFSMSTTSTVSTMALMHAQIYYTANISLLSPLHTLELLSVPL